MSLYPAGGFTSLSLTHEAAENINGREDGKPVVLFYIGDYDQAGVIIDVAIERELRKHLQAGISSSNPKNRFSPSNSSYLKLPLLDKITLMPTKTGRNDACPCGSGQKYKRCCLENDQAVASQVLAAQAAEAAARHARLMAAIPDHDHHAGCDFCGHDDGPDDELTQVSNAAVDLVHDGKLDEAERAARDLIVRFPEVHDGYDRLGMVYEARGENKLAADCYRKVAEFVRAHLGRYGSGFATRFEDMVAELDPPTPG